MMDLELDESRNSLVFIFDPDEVEGACDHLVFLFQEERKKGGVIPFFNEESLKGPASLGEKAGVEFGEECFDIGLRFVRYIMDYLDDPHEIERFNVFLLKAELWHAGSSPGLQ